MFKTWLHLWPYQKELREEAKKAGIKEEGKFKALFFLIASQIFINDHEKNINKHENVILAGKNKPLFKLSSFLILFFCPRKVYRLSQVVFKTVKWQSVEHFFAEF